MRLRAAQQAREPDRLVRGALDDLDQPALHRVGRRELPRRVAMKLFGEWNWWLPRPLERLLPRVSGEEPAIASRA